MKNIVLLVLVFFNLSLTAQSKKYEGSYVATFNINDKGIIEYTLILKTNGTFVFHFYRQLDATQPKENQYGQGAWKVEKDTIFYFYTDKTLDLDASHILDFTNSKARYITKSPRDTSNKVVKTHLRFYDSEISWVKGMKLFKKE